MGRVDLAETFAPVLNDPNVRGYILANSTPSIIKLWDHAGNVDISKDSQYMSLRRRFPNLTVWPMHEFDTMQGLPDGGQRFIFSFTLMNGCRACEVAGSAKVAFDFNTEGRLKGTMLLGLVPASPPIPPEAQWKEGEKHVYDMLVYASVNGGVDHETQILEKKRELEELNVKPSSGRSEKAQELNDRGRMHIENKQFADAVQAFEEAYRANSADIEIVNNLGYAYMKNGNLDTAQQFLYQTLVLSPRRANAWANLGQTYAKKDSTTAAVACFANAYRFSRDKKKTIEFLQNLTQNDDDIRVKQAANQALQLEFIQGKRENVPPRGPDEGTPPVVNEPIPVSGRYEVVRSTPLLKEPRHGSGIVTWLDSGQKVNVTEASGDYLRVESKSRKEPGYISRKDVELVPPSSSAIPSDTATASLPPTTDVATTKPRPERFEYPLTVAVFPLEALGGTRRYSIERTSYEALTKYLLESGRYSVLDSRQLGRRGYSRQGSTESWACEAARNKGAKIAVLGTISDFDLTKDTPPILWFGSRRPRSFYKVSLRVTLRLFATSDCRLVDTFTRSGGRQQVPNRDRDAAMRQVVDEVFQQLTQNIYASLAN